MTTPARPVRPRRMLLVDDSRAVLQLIEDFFTPHGYVVDKALSAEEGLSQLQRRRPDIIVSDVLMPGMDGWTFFEKVRAVAAYRELPFVFLTVESELPMRLRGFQLGADDYVTKPFQVEELHARVERILQRRDQLLRARDAARQAVLAGSTTHLALSDLMQVLAANRKTVVVRVRGRHGGGEVYLVRGELVHAICGRVMGRKALERLLAMEPAVFRVEALSQPPPEHTLEGSTATLIMDALVGMDEWRRWHSRLPPAAARWSVDTEKLRAAASATPVPEEVVRVLEAQPRTDELLDACPVPDGRLAEILVNLLDQGVVRARP